VDVGIGGLTKAKNGSGRSWDALQMVNEKYIRSSKRSSPRSLTFKKEGGGKK